VRSASIPGPFADRIVLFVDGHEIRPSSGEFVAAAPPLATYRFHGRVPADARSLRWYYGLPMDPYPLTIHRADGRIVIEEIAGDAWSRPIDLSGQFRAARVGPGATLAIIAALFVIPISLRAWTRCGRGTT